jgi:2',3'-cyclic-nucleotide 2'-phosphodiesterase (5'-nucleotidase family)
MGYIYFAHTLKPNKATHYIMATLTTAAPLPGKTQVTITKAQPSTGTATPVTPPPASGDSLTLLYHNDLHNAWTQLPRLASAIKAQQQAAQTPVVQLNAGDVAGGNNVPSLQRMLTLLKQWGVNAVGLGNHETDVPPDALTRVLKDVQLPLLAANISLPKHVPVAPAHRVGNVGIVGMAHPQEDWVLSKPYRGNTTLYPFKQSVARVQQAINTQRQQGARHIVVLSHMGVARDQELAKALHHVDVIVGGDSHKVINGVKQGHNWITNQSGTPTLIVQAGALAQHLGVAKLQFYPQGGLAKATNRVIPTHTYPKDPATQQQLEAWLKPNKVLGYILHTVHYEPPFNRSWIPEQLANTIRNGTQADVAMISRREWKADIKKGNITRWSLDSVFPYNEPYAVCELPVMTFLKARHKIDTNRFMMSELRLQTTLRGTPFGLWSEGQKRWLTGQDTMTLAINENFVERRPLRDFPIKLSKPIRIVPGALRDYMTQLLKDHPNICGELDLTPVPKATITMPRAA